MSIVHCPLSIVLSTVFPVTQHCQDVKEQGKQADDRKVPRQIGKAASFQIDHPHHFHQIADRIEPGQCLRPFGHAADRRKQTAQKDKDDKEEENRKHRLLLGGRDGRDSQPESGKCNQIDGRKQTIPRLPTGTSP